MRNIDKKKSNNQKKPKLGRGLGSLLSTGMSDFKDSPPAAVEPQVSKNTLKKAVPVAPKQVAKSQKPPAGKPVVSTQNVVKNKAPDYSEKAEVVQEKVSDALRIWNLSISKVHPNKRQPRKDFEKGPLEELAASIKEQGILQPITVRKSGESYEIIAGERRWRAAQMAGLHEVPVIIKEVSDQKVMELALIENIQRENLNPVEEAIAYQQLIEDYEMSQVEVAKKVGKNRSTITNSLRILTLPKEIKRALRSHEISVGHAKVLLSVEDHSKQMTLLKSIIENNLSVRALEQEVKKRPDSAGDQLEDMEMSERLAQALAIDLQKTLGTKVRIKYRGGKGKIEISYYSDDELNRFSERIKDKWQQNQ